MSNIQTIDPYLSHYIYEKQTNPQAKIYWRQYEKRVVNDIDHIIDISRGKREAVVSSSDWAVVDELIKFYAKRWPNEFEEFRKTIIDIRATRNPGGYSKDKTMRYVGSLPPRLMRLIQVIFPFQQFNKIFTGKLVKNFKLFDIGNQVL